MAASNWMQGFELFRDRKAGKCVICGKEAFDKYRSRKEGELYRCHDDKCRREWERKFGQ
jgi:hypothetical protein